MILVAFQSKCKDTLKIENKVSNESGIHRSGHKHFSKVIRLSRTNSFKKSFFGLDTVPASSIKLYVCQLRICSSHKLFSIFP
jgi:hypothetical protein